MPSQLTFAATKLLRDKLLLRNLVPYNIPGAFTPSSSPALGPLVQNDFSVVDSPNSLIGANPFANNLYKNNEFGPEGGYELDIDGLINQLQPVLPNRGPYGAYPPFTNAIQEYSTSFQKRQYIKNEYTPDIGFIRYYDIGDIIKEQKNATYWDPPSFRPSSYSPFAVLLQADPIGDNGPASDDSRVAQIAVERLKYSYQQRVDQNVRAQTIGRVNILNGLQDPINLSQIIAGRRPIIDRDWKITSGGSNIISQGMDIVERIAGFTFPFSPIPGDYFEQDNLQRDFNSTQSLGQALGGPAARALGGLFGLFGSRPKSPSQVFLDYTGSGQRAQLNMNIDMNRFRPQYNTGGTGIISALGNAIRAGFADLSSQGTYYVGSPEREPTYLTSPPGQIPKNEFGEQVLAPVYGPDILGKDYEGADQNFQFGLAGRAYEDDGNLSGGFSWVSEKWAPNAGRYQKPGGDYGGDDPDYPFISGQFENTQSINYEFKPGSILDDTQRLIDSVPNTGARFGHVGNAIDQTSKVFFDGYKEITKGSQVIRYSDGQSNVGIEYCRLFAKDTPYMTYRDLQKSEGNIRKFSYSVLDSTYNLNIVPYSSKDSTNILNAGGSGPRNVKKYMFSIENLAWRTGYRPGYRVQDLPDCEKGPNGGRIMWFPPYDLQFSEDTRPQFNETTFLGRPEPIYTYKSTSRGGTLKWKIIVDHPSILNLIVNKVLANEGDRPKVDSIVNAFFAGCKKYDLYELAKIYNTVPLTELQAWQEVVNNPNVTREQYTSAVQNVSTETAVAPTSGGATSEALSADFLNSYQQYAFYFENDIPGTNPATTTSTPYQATYDIYVSPTNKQLYSTKAGSAATTVDLFFSDVITSNYDKMQELGSKIFDILQQKQASKVVIDLQGSASSPQTESYNQKLSERRISSVTNFFKTFSFPGAKSLEPYISGGQLVFNPVAKGEVTNVTPKGSGSYESVNCSQNLTGNAKIYSTKAMSCRAVIVTKITIDPIQPQPEPQNVDVNANLASDGLKPQPIKPGQENTRSAVQPTQALYKGASKKLLRYLLSECDYFQVLKEENPFIYDSIKEKIKYFQPAFHSMTPEGLNARLTFLQQCMRPGDTIPTIGPNGEKLYNDATNTAFGAPPVLVLRVGDFYNTKIIPTSLNFSYEKSFDMNPEGIGMQPMIADVTMSFNFVGGSGLKNPIDTLQNALSFNYYANTEMYDERAEATEDTSKLDKEIVEFLTNNPPTVGQSNVNNQQKTDGGNTIGTQTITGSTSSGSTGTIGYKTFVENFISQTDGYFTGTLNFFDNILTNYNYGILSLLNSNGRGNPGYNTGTVSATTVNIYGKPMKYQQYVQESFTKLLAELNADNLPIFTSPGFTNPLITNAQKRLFKKNYQQYIQTYQSGFLNGLTQNLTTLVELEQTLVYNIDRINFVLSGATANTTGYDGKINEKNVALIYSTTGTTETVGGASVNTLNQLGTDIGTISNNLNQFLTDLTSYELYNQTSFDTKTFFYTPPASENVTNTELSTNVAKLEYMLMSRAMLVPANKKGFMDSLVLGLDQATTNAVNFFYDGLGNNDSRFNKWTRVNTANKELLTTFRTSTTGVSYEDYKPTIQPNQTRILVFSEDLLAPQTKKTQLQNIYSGKNDTALPTPYNLKRKFN
jgi:outer membrane protein OmpA-like peptidoglycan-associated protein